MPTVAGAVKVAPTVCTPPSVKVIVRVPLLKRVRSLKVVFTLPSIAWAPVPLKMKPEPVRSTTPVELLVKLPPIFHVPPVVRVESASVPELSTSTLPETVMFAVPVNRLPVRFTLPMFKVPALKPRLFASKVPIWVTAVPFTANTPVVMSEPVALLLTSVKVEPVVARIAKSWLP